MDDSDDDDKDDDNDDDNFNDVEHVDEDDCYDGDD